MEPEVSTKSKFVFLFERLKSSNECIHFCVIISTVIVILAFVSLLEFLGYMYNVFAGHRITFWTNFGEGIVLFLLIFFYVCSEWGMYHYLWIIWDKLEVEFGGKLESEITDDYRGNVSADTGGSLGFLVVTYAFSWLFLYGVWHNPSEQSLFLLVGIGVFITARLILFGLLTPPLVALIYHTKTLFFPLNKTDSTSINKV